MQRLVALDLAGGPRFVETVQQCWANGDVVFVVDQRLDQRARERLLAQVRPHEVVGPEPAASHRWPDPSPPLEDGDALLVATSGSTGTPKLLVHTHRSLRAHANAVHHRLEVDPSRDRWLACLPLNHLGGFGVVARSILSEMAVDVLGAFDADAVARAPARWGATLTALVPTALDRIDPAEYRMVVLGGASDSTPRPANVVRTYGLTETGGGVVYDGNPLTGVEVRVDPDGHIAIRSATVARGSRQPDATVVPLVDSDGWLTTGDLGRYDDTGRLQVLGRADHLIITGGENVWPEPVEAALAQHALVADAVVFGEPDPQWGQRVVAVVVPQDQDAPPSVGQLRAHLGATLPEPALPKVVRIRRHIERTALGKPVRPQ